MSLSFRGWDNRQLRYLQTYSAPQSLLNAEAAVTQVKQQIAAQTLTEAAAKLRPYTGDDIDTEFARVAHVTITHLPQPYISVRLSDDVDDEVLSYDFDYSGQMCACDDMKWPWVHRFDEQTRNKIWDALDDIMFSFYMRLRSPHKVFVPLPASLRALWIALCTRY